MCKPLKKSSDIKWGQWFVGNGKPPYEYAGEPVRHEDLDMIYPIENPTWSKDELFQLPEKHPHYTPEGQLYYLKQQFPNDIRVQKLDLLSIDDPSLDLILARKIAEKIYTNRTDPSSFNTRVTSSGEYDIAFNVKEIIKWIKKARNTANDF